MSTSTHATTLTGATDATLRLRDLYVARFGFASVWAVLVALTGSSLNPASVALLLVYPLVDALAAVIDLRSANGTRPSAALYVNIAVSLITSLGLAVAVSSGIPDVLRVWGAWAITAGLVQLGVAVQRYRLGGQGALILSGGISALAGTSFILQAGTSSRSLTTLAAYATLGGIFFLTAAIRLHRRTASP
jgi:hypothetical protein